jgi:hypothetical protein
MGYAMPAVSPKTLNYKDISLKSQEKTPKPKSAFHEKGDFSVNYLHKR